jgi:hypothetical protein
MSYEWKEAAFLKNILWILRKTRNLTLSKDLLKKDFSDVESDPTAHAWEGQTHNAAFSQATICLANTLSFRWLLILDGYPSDMILETC